MSREVPEEVKKFFSYYGKIGVKSRMEKVSPDRRKEIARKANAASVAVRRAKAKAKAAAATYNRVSARKKAKAGQ